MQYLLNPDVAYLILVTGFVLILLAIITPGTGILEIGAVFVILAAAYSIIKLPLNLWAFGLIFIGGILFTLSIWRTRHHLTLGFSLLFLVIGSAYLFQGTQWWLPAVNPFLAAFVSILVSGFFWIAGRKTIEASQRKPHHELDQLIGKFGEAKTNIHQEGTVQVESELWSAYSQVPIPRGSRVQVIKRDGFLLEVAQVPKEDNSAKY